MLETKGLKNKKSHFWDILLVRENGEWLGVRAPWDLLQRVATYFAILLLLSALSITGWISSRWMSQKLRDSLAQESLRSASLETQVQDLKKQLRGAGISSAAGTSSGQISTLPSLDKDEFSAGLLKLSLFEVEYDPKTFDLAIKFDLSRDDNTSRDSAYYWVALLHSNAGIMSFPPALNGQSGDLVLPHRGQTIEAMQSKRSVLARYKVRGFIEEAGVNPVYCTLSIFDSKGSLLLRQRTDLNLKRARILQEENR